ncbi:hypothetical protein EUX98_g5600 [Antrodiella citrinella]|uniref:Ubiquitin-like domain-containing protein n=1 Tax=Antrodiella citrinella TaxID=2447956 RepID=A0A4S4MTA8_9APHY|nr:hypothetical protein EUX98_g5600 [Antrodiella citrinella]
MRYEARTILVPRPKTYEVAITLARKHFKSLAGKEVYFHIAQVEIAPAGETVELTDDVWEDVVMTITSVNVGCRPLDDAGLSDAGPIDPAVPPEKRTIVMNIFYSGFKEEIPSHTIKCKPSTRWSQIHHAVSKRMVGLCSDGFYLLYYGERVFHYGAVGDMVDDDDVCDICVSKEQLGGKPVVYIWTPQAQQVTVDLSLVPQWEFSVLYPIAPIVPAKFAGSTGQRTTWNVVTRDDGTLLDQLTGLEVTYLFWEAVPALDVTAAFNPVNATLTDDDSVLLCVAELTPYLDACLKALGLHTEARTSFITYWLPSLLKHEYVALRFVPQDSYSQAAPMTVEPSPDVIVRVFMIFKGVLVEGVGSWPLASARVQKDVSHWRKVVGLSEVDQLHDRSLFRVLEWGGMEILTAVAIAKLKFVP